MTNEETTTRRTTTLQATSPGTTGALAGAAGAAVGLGFGELMEGAFESIPSLVVAVSELLSDYTPGDVVRFSIANFGASQKTLLTVGIVVVTLALGGALGRSAARGQLRVTLSGFALFGLLGGWAAARNPISPAAGSWIVGLAAAVLAAAATLGVVRLAGRRAVAAAPEAADRSVVTGTTRRSFFYAAGAGAAVTVKSAAPPSVTPAPAVTLSTG